MLGDILGLMDHLGLWRVDLMGYSMGARLALQTALAHPSRVSNLIVGGVGGRMFEPPPASEQPAMTMAEAMTAEDPESIKDATLRGFRLFAEQQGEDRLALAAVTQGRGGAAIAKEDLAAIAMPALVVAGQRDQMAGDPQALADLIPGAKAVTLPACDHFSAIPHALFKAAVFDFLDGWLE
jgi:pimeloyl-ACP methyl ester carboxylesterase